VLSLNREMHGAARWLTEEGYDAIVVDETMVANDLPSWSRTAKSLGGKLITWSVRPHSVVTLPWGLTKTMVQRGSELHVNGERLQRALLIYRDIHDGAIGVKLGRITGGNTKVVAFVPADTLTPIDIRLMLNRWVNDAPAFQKIGHSPGQAYGEIAIGLSMLGAAGFRFQQPVEIYPQFLYYDLDAYRRHTKELLSDSLIERLPKPRHPGEYLLKQAPAFLQASFLYIPTGEIAMFNGHETRVRWMMYKKPKLASGVFNNKNLERLLRYMGQ
jgi:hypothetical protein